ncbi:DUF3192 domain-containing protein [Aestuariibacter halophilus]|uniref:DUF3192 domain-containing protein n=1 Tax=Fluctibacter halophilus TaxID=226011 RepID=A0ABS8G314_9ALTE|nr:DUF3192 domain-containing protein [Aestuariibacter halophilus]MCC2614838.1 DUF3192 domain-containing protein [Aestuariibacter halophilus]
MKKSILAAVFTLPVLLSGCVVSVGGDDDYGYHRDWQDREQDNRRYIADLNLDVTLASTKRKMGTPDFTESYQQGDDQITVLFYRTHRHDGDGMTTKDECTPLVFKNERLIGWGDTAYAQI